MTDQMSALAIAEKQKQKQLKKCFLETEHYEKALQNQDFIELYEQFEELSLSAEKELLLPEEPDNGNTEYKLKLASPTMERIEHLTTQMVFRLNEG